jgi:ribonuclease HI
MIKMTVYCDGSERDHCKNHRKHTYQGWGFVAHHNEDTDEVFDGIKLKNIKQRGFHEIHAFYAAVQYAESYGYKPHEVSFHSDCDWLRDANFHLHAGNYSKSRSKFMKRVIAFQHLFFPGDRQVAVRMTKWLLNARICWVKGHDSTVYNLRADQLATAAVTQIKTKKEVRPVFFSTWLESGIDAYDRIAEEHIKVHLPFCHPGMMFVEA